MLHHILGFKHDAFTITGRDQLGTINERLYIIFPGTRHYKLCQLANGRESWHGCEEKQRQQKRKYAKYSNMPTAPGLKPHQSVCLTNDESKSICIERYNLIKYDLRCIMDTLWWPFRTGISRLACSVKRKEHWNSLRSTSSKKRPVKDNSQRSPKHTLISGKAAGVSLAHGMWCWCDCWNCPDITVCVQFHSGNSQLEFSSLVHNEDSQPLGMTTDCAKDRGAGGGVQGAGGRLSYLKLHSHGHCNSAGILYQSGCSLSWSSGLTMIWEKVNRHNSSRDWCCMHCMTASNLD